MADAFAMFLPLIAESHHHRAAGRLALSLRSTRHQHLPLSPKPHFNPRLLLDYISRGKVFGHGASLLGLI